MTSAEVADERTIQNALQLCVDPSKPGKLIDLGCYALGQGGLHVDPMLKSHTDAIKRLKPRTIRFFIQEYFNLYPSRGEYNFALLYQTLESICATGATPIPSICFKPPVLFPKLNQDIVHPESYAEWQELIVRLVKHCKERGFDIEYWEIGNEVDAGENGGCPYRFSYENYPAYYTATAAAILRADPGAKVGGPTLLDPTGPIGDALIDHCGQGKAQLDFFSFHRYTNDPESIRGSIQLIKSKLAKYPRLKNTGIIIDEWNAHLFKRKTDPNFQPAFVLETTRVFEQEGILSAAYYHIRDQSFDSDSFAGFMSEEGRRGMAHFWNIMPTQLGLFDEFGRVRPAYFAFYLMSLLKGQRLQIDGLAGDVHGWAALRERDEAGILLWNFPQTGNGRTEQVELNLPPAAQGMYQAVQLNSERHFNNLEIIEHGLNSTRGVLPIHLTLEPYQIVYVSYRGFL